MYLKIKEHLINQDNINSIETKNTVGGEKKIIIHQIGLDIELPYSEDLSNFIAKYISMENTIKIYNEL